MQATIRRYGVFPRWIGKARRARLSRFGQSVADLFEESAIMKKILLAAALTAVCGVAAAQGYAGALIGMGKLDADVACPTGVSCDDTDTAYKLYGGYNVSNDVAVEMAYTNFGELTISGPGGSAGVKVHAISVGGAMRFPMTTDLTGVGRLGVAFLKGKGTGAISGTDADSTELYLGLGLEYSAMDDVKLVGAFDITDGGNVYILGVGAQVGF